MLAAVARAGGAALRRAAAGAGPRAVAAAAVHTDAPAASSAAVVEPASASLVNEDFDLTEEQLEFKNVARSFAEEELAPHRWAQPAAGAGRQRKPTGHTTRWGLGAAGLRKCVGEAGRGTAAPCRYIVLLPCCNNSSDQLDP